MPSTDVPAEFSAPQSFHPEFGYLCPSAPLRRQVRRAFVTVVAAMAVAASAALAVSTALVPNGPDAGTRERTKAAATASPAVDMAAEAAPPGSLAPAIAAPERIDPARAQASCDDLAISFLISQCQAAKPGRSPMTRVARAARAANHRAASVSSGRPDEPSAQPQMAEAGTADAAVVAIDQPPIPLRPERPAAPIKKPAKIAHKRAPGPDNAGTETAAAAPKSGFDFFGLFHQPSRSASGAWAMSR
jgi:hypothetical protein